MIRNQVSAKEYIGITVTPLQARLRGHHANAKKGVKGKLYNAMRHYGVENFTIELVRSDALSFAELQEQEIDEIVRRGTLNGGYNTSPGGSIGTPTEITVAGVTYPSRGAGAAHFGIDVTVFNLRVSRLGWTPEQAAEIESRVAFARHRVNVGEHSFASLRAAAGHFDVDYKVAFSRVQTRGWTIEQALNLAPPPTRNAKGKATTVAGVVYPSVAEACRRLGKEPSTVHMRIQLGWSPDEAFDFVPHMDRRGTWSGEQFTVLGVTYPSRAAAAKAHGLAPILVT